MVLGASVSAMIRVMPVKGHVTDQSLGRSFTVTIVWPGRIAGHRATIQVILSAVMVVRIAGVLVGRGRWV